MKNLLFLFIMSITIVSKTVAQPKKQDLNKYLFIGTYTQKTSEGIYVYKFNTKTGDFKPVSIAKNIKNPSFLTISSDKKYIYAVSEIDKKGAVNAYKFDKKTGELKLINSVSAKGDGPCHAEINKEGNLLSIANYSEGNLSVFQINKDGSLADNPQVIQHSGSGPNKGRQEKAHMHSTNWIPGKNEFLAVDLGTDQVVHYQINNGKLEPMTDATTHLKPGAGPRHLTFHKNGQLVYVINELDNTITCFKSENNKFVQFQNISTLPADFKEVSYCADIHISPDGKFLYGSNRGHNSLAIYKIESDGMLKLVDIQSVKGAWPRNFLITEDGSFILVANQNSDNITIFKRNKTTGKIITTGKEIKVSMPICLKMM
jgi:6-phosphogluconolactonase